MFMLTSSSSTAFRQSMTYVGLNMISIVGPAYFIATSSLASPMSEAVELTVSLPLENMSFVECASSIVITLALSRASRRSCLSTDMCSAVSFGIT